MEQSKLKNKTIKEIQTGKEILTSNITEMSNILKSYFINVDKEFAFKITKPSTVLSRLINLSSLYRQLTNKSKIIKYNL